VYDDPGWGKAAKRALFPYSQFIHRLRPRTQTDSLSAIRQVFLGVVMALPLFAFILLFIVPRDRWWKTDRSHWVIVVVLAVGCGTSLLVGRIRDRRLDASSAQRVAQSFVAKLFIGIGYAEVTALVAFIGTFIMYNLWIYLVGFAFSMINFILVGPTKREIARRQEQIAAEGSSLSLGAALMAMPPRQRKT
jgi:F0F1-type ATP synthase membrane subunit c/vacuolar-type H+-ATPase subunit K